MISAVDSTYSRFLTRQGFEKVCALTRGERVSVKLELSTERSAIRYLFALCLRARTFVFAKKIFRHTHKEQ
jgi:hypothetical protein